MNKLGFILLLSLLIISFLITNQSLAGERMDDMFRRPNAKAWYEDHDKIALELGLGWDPEFNNSRGGWLRFHESLDDWDHELFQIRFDWTFNGLVEDGPGEWFIRPIVWLDFTYYDVYHTRTSSTTTTRTETTTETKEIVNWEWVPKHPTNCSHWRWKHPKWYSHWYKNWYKNWKWKVLEKFVTTETTTTTTIIKETITTVYIESHKEWEITANFALQLGIFRYDDANFAGAAWGEVGFRNRTEWYASMNSIFAPLKWIEVDAMVEGIWPNGLKGTHIGRIGLTLTQDIYPISIFGRVGGVFPKDFKGELELIVGIQAFFK